MAEPVIFQRLRDLAEVVRNIRRRVEVLEADDGDDGGGGVPGTTIWGEITGTLSNQTDLNNALSGKAATAHTHIIANVTGLQAALDAKLDDSQLSGYGGTLISAADASAARTTLGLGSISTQGSGAVNITGGTIAGIADLAVADGGTGASTAGGALTNLGVSAFVQTILDDADAAAVRGTIGLGSIATQSASSVAITGGSVAGITDLAIADGGTGASTAGAALTNLGFSAFAQTIIDDVDAAAVRSTIGLGSAAVLSTSDVDERARDALGAALTAGTGITITPNDGADTITVASTITQYTDENARDAIGAALVAGANVTITVNDGADTITIAASGGGGGSGGTIGNIRSGGWFCSTDARQGATANLSTQNIVLYPMERLSVALTIAELGARVTTSAAGTNFQMGIYAADATTGEPTGNPLAVTGNVSSASAVAISGALLANVTLQPNTEYFIGAQASTSAPNFQCTNGDEPRWSQLQGAQSLATLTTGAGVYAVPWRYTVGAFGTWPDLTGVGATRTTGPGCTVYCKVA